MKLQFVTIVTIINDIIKVAVHLSIGNANVTQMINAIRNSDDENGDDVVSVVPIILYHM